MALKNLFGAIHNPNKYHLDVGDPYVADVYMLPPIRQKVRLTICDATTAQYEGGPSYMPQWTWPFNGLDRGARPRGAGLHRLADHRAEARRERHQAAEGGGREPSYIATAADGPPPRDQRSRADRAGGGLTAMDRRVFCRPPRWLPARVAASRRRATRSSSPRPSSTRSSRTGRSSASCAPASAWSTTGSAATAACARTAAASTTRWSTRGSARRTSIPIEKKPFFHFLPGTLAFSIATAGCNVNCKMCQNWEISQVRPEQVRSDVSAAARSWRRWRAQNQCALDRLHLQRAGDLLRVRAGCGRGGARRRRQERGDHRRLHPAGAAQAVLPAAWTPSRWT